MEDDAGAAGYLGVLSFWEMPKWFREDNNQWIVGGYRPISGSVGISFRSWWYVHNETVNIYSHLVPAVLFLVGEWFVVGYVGGKYPGVTGGDLVAFSFFMVTASICYGLSAVYHTLMNHSYEVGCFWHRLDMFGIGIFIIGDIVLGVYIIFWCEASLRNTYWCMVS